MKKNLLRQYRKSGLITIFTIMVLVSSALSIQAKTIQITISDNNPKMSVTSRVVAHWASEIEKRSNGKIKMNVHYGGVLLKQSEVFRGVQRGAVDVGYYVLDRKNGFYLNSVITLPFMGWPDQSKTGQIFQDLIKTQPEMKKEWKGVIPIVFAMMPPAQIHNNKREIRIPADLKGLKFHGAEHALVQILAEFGATPIQMDITDMYMSLDRGLINGVMNHFPVLSVFGVLKLMNYHTILGKGGINMTPVGMIWNKRSWNRLPNDLKLIIQDVNKLFLKTFYDMDRKAVAKAKSNIKKWGHKITYLTKEERQTWFDLVKGPIHDEWVQHAEDRGLPGKAVYNGAISLIKKYNQ